ncbi:hypothetical protein R9C00_09715 [Flammeovirgaceae bacterium SG7u.111]|nr:hypothetical protein [Flammeovirgaceae bacterium SG7u.132]WPO37727.1 hypothetical protein R9C00_09715 [Flammeovirgaceae bacterium SG7u.111]
MDYYDKKKVDSIGKYIDLMLAKPSDLELAASAGYPKKEIERVAKLHKEVVELRQISTVAKGRRYSATDAFNFAMEQLKEHYAPIKEIAYVHFEDNREAYSTLDLNGIRDTVFDEMKIQVKVLYEGILSNANYLKEMGTRGISKAHLEAGLKLHADMLDLKRIQTLAEEERKEAKETLMRKANELEKWHSKAKRIIRAYSKVKPVATT